MQTLFQMQHSTTFPVEVFPLQWVTWNALENMNEKQQLSFPSTMDYEHCISSQR